MSTTLLAILLSLLAFYSHTSPEFLLFLLKSSLIDMHLELDKHPLFSDQKCVALVLITLLLLAIGTSNKFTKRYLFYTSHV